MPGDGSGGRGVEVKNNRTLTVKKGSTSQQGRERPPGESAARRGQEEAESEVILRERERNSEKHCSLGQRAEVWGGPETACQGGKEDQDRNMVYGLAGWREYFYIVCGKIGKGRGLQDHSLTLEGSR